METTRREAFGLAAGGLAAAAMMGAAGSAVAAPRLGSATKTLFWTATVTPCDRNMKFDPGAMREVMAYFKDQGADGVVVLGTSGEFPSFSVAERKQVTEVCMKAKNGMNVMVGPGTPNIAETIELAKHAQDNGADSLLVIPPFYFNNPSDDGLIRYYTQLFEAVSIPINLYHIPGTSEVPITLPVLRALSRYDHLAGIKDSSGSAEGYAAFVQAFPQLNMRTGTNNNLERALNNGMGAILADGNIFPRLCADVFKAYHAKQDYKPALEKLRAAQKIMRPAAGFSQAAMKYALSVQMGVPEFYARPPMDLLSDAQKTAIRNALAETKKL